MLVPRINRKLLLCGPVEQAKKPCRNQGNCKLLGECRDKDKDKDRGSENVQMLATCCRIPISIFFCWKKHEIKKFAAKFGFQGTIWQLSHGILMFNQQLLRYSCKKTKSCLLISNEKDLFEYYLQPTYLWLFPSVGALNRRLDDSFGIDAVVRR